MRKGGSSALEALEPPFVVVSQVGHARADAGHGVDADADAGATMGPW
jgi:hypothetical protein